MKRRLIVELEIDILDQEGPDIVAESVGIEVSFKRKTRLDFVGYQVREGLVKVLQDLHGKLWLDLIVSNEIIQSIGQSNTDTGVMYM